MESSHEHSYSTLEAVNPNHNTLEYAQRPDYSTLQHHRTHSGLEVGYQAEGRNSEKQIAAGNGLEVGSEPAASLRHPAASRRKRWIVAAAVISLVVLGAILGGVLGSKIHHTKASSTSTTTGIGTPSSNPSNSSTTNTTSPSLSQRNIAAVSFIDLARNNTRLYLQDDAGHIWQGSNDERNRLSWTWQNLGGRAKIGSPLTAAVLLPRPGFPLVISLFYLDINNVVNDMFYNATSKGFGRGILGDRQYKSMSNGSLAAMYDQCDLCGNNPLFAFQDQNGSVQIGNYSKTDGWSLTQLGPENDPLPGTALATRPNYRAGLRDQVDLHYQRTSNLDLTQVSFRDISTGWEFTSSNNDTSTMGLVMAPYSPIATATSYYNLSNGNPGWMETIELQATGVHNDFWSGPDATYHHISAGALANSTTNPQVYGSLALTATGNGFGVIRRDGKSDGIVNWQLQDNAVEWRLIGNVALENGTWV